MSEFRMPSLGADMEAGTLVEWTKRPGEPVKRGDIIAVVDTAKGAIEIEVFEDGVLDAIHVQPGTKVPVGTVLATIRGAGAPAPAPVMPPAAAIASAAPIAPAAPFQGQAPARSGARVHASPVARKAAAALGIDLAAVRGSGPDGAITRDDVERAARTSVGVAVAAPPEPSQPAAQPRHVDTSAMRAAIAASMSRSKREIPHYYLTTTIDLQRAMAWLRAENERRSMHDRLLPAALLLKAVALALEQVPELNGHWVDGGFRPGAGIHIGCAIALRDGGLVAPALHDANKKDLTTIMREMTDLVARARAGTLRSSEIADPTITVTSLGELGVDAAYGVIYPPQVAIVGFGRIAERPWAVDGRVEARPLVVATLAADHRASDGHRGGRLLMAVDRALQEPAGL